MLLGLAHRAAAGSREQLCINGSKSSERSVQAAEAAMSVRTPHRQACSRHADLASIGRHQVDGAIGLPTDRRPISLDQCTNGFSVRSGVAED